MKDVLIRNFHWTDNKLYYDKILILKIKYDEKKIMYKKGTCFNRLDQAITHVVDRVEKIPGFFVI